MYIRDLPDFIVSKFIENSIGPKRVKIIFFYAELTLVAISNVWKNQNQHSCVSVTCFGYFPTFYVKSLSELKAEPNLCFYIFCGHSCHQPVN